MNVTTQAPALRASLALAVKVAKGATLPLLQHVRIACDGKTLTVFATDGSTYLDRRLHDYGSGETFDVLLPMEAAKALVKALPRKGEATFRVDGQTLHAYGLSLPTTSSADYPAMPEGGPVEHAIMAPAPALAAAIRYAATCASGDPTRPQLESVALSRGAAVGTDGFRLAVAPLPQLPMAEPDFAALVPGPMLEAVMAALEMVDGNAELKWSGSAEDGPTCLTLQAPGLTLHGYAPRSSYPAWWKVVPAEHSFVQTVQVDRGALRAALKAVRAVADRYNADVALRFEQAGAAGGQLHLTLTHPDKGAASASLPYVGEYTGTAGLEGRLMFNSRYLLDWVDAAETDRLVLACGSEVAVWRLTGGAGTTYLMPARAARV